MPESLIREDPKFLTGGPIIQERTIVRNETDELNSVKLMVSNVARLRYGMKLNKTGRELLTIKDI